MSERRQPYSLLIFARKERPPDYRPRTPVRLAPLIPPRQTDSILSPSSIFLTHPKLASFRQNRFPRSLLSGLSGELRLHHRPQPEQSNRDTQELASFPQNPPPSEIRPQPHQPKPSPSNLASFLQNRQTPASWLLTPGSLLPYSDAISQAQLALNSLLVRYFLSSRHPEITNILLVESGSRSIAETVAPVLYQNHSEAARIDLVSCFATLPRGFNPETSRIYRVADFRGREGRRKLYNLLRQNGYSHIGLICSEEPLMTKWKWALAGQLPAKVFIVNENADYFWFDLSNRKLIRQFVLTRTGLGGAGAVRTLARAISFPFTFFYLLLYATAAHARRALRKHTL